MEDIEERLARALGFKFYTVVEEGKKTRMLYDESGLEETGHVTTWEFDPLNDSDLFKQCLIELYAEANELEIGGEGYFMQTIDAEANTNIEEFVYTAYIIMKKHHEGC